jgi:hypothetical protein
MFRKMYGALAISTMTVVCVTSAQAEETSKDVSSVSTHQESKAPAKKYGVYASIGNPYPTLLGVNAAYNINSNLRATVGYGEVEATSSLTFDDNGFHEEKVTAKTYAAGAEYLFLNSPVHGIVGLRAGYFDVSGKGKIEIDGFKKSTGYVYSNAGIDWIGESGYQVGAGMNVSLVGASGAGFYLNSGYFF